ncbi:YfhE family protein [Aquibacillus sp. 3ASR75-11]|uniref:YfhE family protein n=1 Tax=Terrihalobacillus insolitus TaxID=2950438 RepID=A0A9X4AMY3_9BACI|nr:YfhE family protein [Terrihalobacillus insolitus]MDC3425274.1 YfhE family protein [Terrihalobacillus insolitus]
MRKKQTLREQKTNLSKTQEVLYQREFKAANRAFNHSRKE